MFSCRACTRHALTVLLESSLPTDTSRATLRKCVSTLKTTPLARTFATNSATVTREIGSKQVTRREDETKPRKSKSIVSKSTERSVNKRMEFMDDPFHIAKEVQRILASDRFEEAALLARNASSKYKVTVAWNHLIEHQMRELKLHAAIKTYNEMKKRAQLPNAQTYTIIFKGCALSPHPKLAVTEAVKLYNNMLASERISPNTIHLNAVLQVCAKAEDLETMFTLVKTMNTGVRAPNNLTYTTILNALRAPFNKPHRRDVPTQDNSAEIQRAIQRARAIWEEVMKSWRDARVTVDEELVCAMGRILLMGGFHENNDIFALIEQTMGITKEPQLLSAMAWRCVKSERLSSSTDHSVNSSEPVPVRTEPKGQSGSSVVLVYPGKNSLSMVLTAIENTGKANLARRYWIVFTKNYNVVPDANNWYALFRALRRGKSSTKAAEYMAEMPKSMVSPKIFRTAMYTCVRDNLNKSSFKNATQILEVMLSGLRIPDMSVLRTYLRVAYANKKVFDEMAGKNDPDSVKLAWGRQICLALENLWEPYQIVFKQYSHTQLPSETEDKATEDQEKEAWIQNAPARAELAALARKMIAAHDRLISKAMVPPIVAKRLEPRRNALNRFVVKYFEDKDKFEPGWNREAEELASEKEEEDDWEMAHKERW